jgi:signal transduction histidine kinase
MSKKLTSIKLGWLLNLIAGVAFTLVAVIAVVLANRQARQQALAEAESKDRLLLDHNLAIHTYFTHQLKPSLFERTELFQDEGYFDPTWMSSTFAVREIDKYFKSLHYGDYYYKEAAINARSPENEADAYERAFIEELNADPQLEDRSEIRVLDGEPYFVTLRRGETMEQTCLRCHSTPDQAPQNLVRVYGPERSFGREIGQAVSAIAIHTPLSTTYRRANAFSLWLSGLLLVLLLGLFVVQYWFNARLLYAPLSRIRNKALQIASGGEHLGQEIPLPWGQELRQLTSDFNTMSVSLRRNVDYLEERVRERTARLKRAEQALIAYSERLEDMVKERTQELQEAQEKLVRRERLAVLGQLAGGVSHELRNPLGAINNAAYFLDMALEDPSPEVQEALGILSRKVKTAENIINGLLDVARGKPPTRQEIDLDQVVQEALSQAAVPEHIEVTVQLDEALPTILADPDQLGQVFGNLILNAIQAMTLPSSIETPQGGQLNIQSLVPSSGWVAVSISDTGVGIPPENLDKLFEPLFTTKSKGIGLGLTLVKSLVEGNGGRIKVQSQAGEGSTFTVSLPAGVN